VNDRRQHIKDSLRNKVEDIAREDWLGLYEILWAMNGLDPSLSQSEKQALSLQVARELISQPTFQLVAVTWPVPKSERLVQRDAEAALGDLANWNPPSEGQEYLAIRSVD
jgi:hypothetical protein